MGLTRQDMAKIRTPRDKGWPSDFEVFLDEVHVLLCVRLRPTHDDGVLSAYFS